MEIQTGVKVLGIVGFHCNWKVTDEKTMWEVGFTFALLKVDIIIRGSSDWLISNKNIGGLLRSAKKYERFKVGFDNKAIKKIVQKVNAVVKKVGTFLKDVWSSVTSSIKEGREKAKQITDKLCFRPPCVLSEVLSTFAGLVNGFFGFISGIFGKTKTSTSIIPGKFNEFNCPYYMREVKKCVFGKCKVKSRDEYVDKACMDNVKAELLYAEHLEELAQDRDNILAINMLKNMGYQYVIEELEKGNEIIFSEDDLILENIVHDFEIDEFKRSLRSQQIARQYSRQFTNQTDNFDDQHWQEQFDSILTSTDNGTFDSTHVDLNDVYHNDQDLKLNIPLKIKTSRLASTFKGIEKLAVDLTIPVSFDITDEETFQRSVDSFYESLEDENGPLIKAIIGDNLGISKELEDIMAMRPPYISLQVKKN
jgi:hypothetical protein